MCVCVCVHTRGCAPSQLNPSPRRRCSRGCAARCCCSIWWPAGLGVSRAGESRGGPARARPPFPEPSCPACPQPRGAWGAPRGRAALLPLPSNSAPPLLRGRGGTKGGVLCSPSLLHQHSVLSRVPRLVPSRGEPHGQPQPRSQLPGRGCVSVQQGHRSHHHYQLEQAASQQHLSAT